MKMIDMEKLKLLKIGGILIGAVLVLGLEQQPQRKRKLNRMLKLLNKKPKQREAN